MTPYFDKINLFLPTYGRIKSGVLAKHIESFTSNVSSLDNMCYTFLVNHDDEETLHYLTSNPSECDFQILTTQLPKPCLGKFYNQMYNESAWKIDNSVLISMVGDDMVCETKDWDLPILEAINKLDGLGFVYCRDGLKNETLCVNLFTTRKWINALGGEFMNEDFAADHIDTIHQKIGEMTRRKIYLPNVYLKHNHNSQVSFDQQDETFKRLRLQYSDANPVNTDKVIWDYINSRLNNLSVYLNSNPSIKSQYEKQVR